MKRLLLGLALLVATACGEGSMTEPSSKVVVQPAVTSLAPYPATSTWIVQQDVLFISKCTGLRYTGVVRYHYEDHNRYPPDESQVNYRGRVNTADGSVVDNLEREYRFQFIGDGRSTYSNEGGFAEYQNDFRLVPTGPDAVRGVETFTLKVRLEWEPFVVSTSIESNCT